MSQSKKRKVDHEQRVFQMKWELEYLFIEHNDTLTCLVCRKTVAVPKEYNLKRHYEQLHQDKFVKFEGKNREEKVSQLKEQLRAQQNCFVKARTMNDDAVKASYIVSHMIASHTKPFTEGEFLKECMVQVADTLCPEKKVLFQNISLSRNTVAERINEISSDLHQKLCQTAKTFFCFSLAMDDSTDARDVAQLAIFIRGCDTNFDVTEELLELFPMEGTTTGADIFAALETCMNRSGLLWSKLSGLTTDGAPCMLGENMGLVGQIKRRLECETSSTAFTSYHCIIHQENLCAKLLTMEHVMSVVIHTVNFIHSHGLNHCQFAAFLEELNSKYGELLYYSAVWWLSCGNLLKRFCSLLRDCIIHGTEGKTHCQFFMQNLDLGSGFSGGYY
jgi:hypothetical protein